MELLEGSSKRQLQYRNNQSSHGLRAQLLELRGPQTSGAVIWRYLSADERSVSEAPDTSMPVFVDVRDVAHVHLAAYKTSSPVRFLICGGSYTYSQVCDLLRSRLPQIKDRIAKPRIGAASDESHYVVSAEKAAKTLGNSFRPFETTFVDMAKEFLAMEEAAAAER